MRIINARNVNDAYRQGRALLQEIGVPQNSRSGQVLVAPCPVTTVYEKPTERVLMDEGRNASPFFHLAESIWMLAGQDDARWLDTYVRDFSARFAEADGHMHGAYGYRWRNHFLDVHELTRSVDQLQIIIDRLRRDPDDRRVVLSMWDPEFDLFGPEYAETWAVEPKDVPCNLVVMPRIREELRIDTPTLTEQEKQERWIKTTVSSHVLDITVVCRSNDVVWGAYGANAVHFSVLQEYLSAAIGIAVGKMYQVSNNWHGYADVLAKMPMDQDDDLWCNPYVEGAWVSTSRGTRVGESLQPQPMVTDPRFFLGDCERFVHERGAIRSGKLVSFCNDWFTQTLVPMELAHAAWKDGDASCAVGHAEQIRAPDWRAAALAWLYRRMK